MTDTILATRHIEGPGPLLTVNTGLLLTVNTFPLQMLVSVSSTSSYYTLHLTREKALRLADAMRECAELMGKAEVEA